MIDGGSDPSEESVNSRSPENFDALPQDTKIVRAAVHPAIGIFITLPYLIF